MSENLEVGGGAGESTPVSQKPIESSDPLIVSLQNEVSLLSKQMRGLQGRQDKTDDTVKKSEQTVLEKVKELMKGGLTIDEAQREIEWQTVRDTVLKPNTATASLAQVDTPAKSNSGEEVKALVQELQLDLNDQRVAELYSKNDIVGLAKLAVSRVSPSPDVSNAPPVPGGVNNRQEDADEISNQIFELSKNKTLNREKIEALKKRRGY